MRPPLVILAGGKGTRLGELTKDTPKPMVDIFGKPFLYWLIKHYISQGFEDITISTGYKAEVIEQYHWTFGIDFKRDTKEGKYFALETLIKEYSPCWIVNGDTWLTNNIPEAFGQLLLLYNGINAGAQHISNRPDYTDIDNIGLFYDIGTPEGLELFKEYFKSHPLYLSELTQSIV